MSDLKSSFVLDGPARRQPVGGPLIANLVAGSRYLSQRGPRFAITKSWQAVRLLLAFHKHVRVVDLLAHPQCATLTREHSRLPFKYLSAYIALGLPLRVRREILYTHYRFLRQRFLPTFIDAVLQAPPVLWQAAIDDAHFAISVDFPESDYEGDLRLVLTMGDREVYKLIFAFAPGRDFGQAHDTIIVLTNIQGAPDFERVKAATKKCHDIQPAHILMAALSGLAEVTHIPTLIGFHESRQISSGKTLFFSYRQFFETYGEEISGRKVYRVRLPYFERPLSEIKVNHRRRNLRKREFKADIRTQVARAVERWLI